MVVRAMFAADHGAASARGQRRAIAECAVARSRRVENEARYRSVRTDAGSRDLEPLNSTVANAPGRGHSELGREPGIARGFVPVDVEPACHVRQQLSQLHGVPGAAAAPRLLEGVSAPFVGL
jgi:hypothetical protein